MSDAAVLLFLAAVALHNLEEAIWLPAWSRRGRSRWRRPIGTVAFGFAAAVLTAAAAGLGALAILDGSQPWDRLLAGWAVAQSLNVVFPHAIAALATRSYAPGLGTGLVLILPSSAALIGEALESGRLGVASTALMGLLVAVTLAVATTILLGLGRRIERAPPSGPGHAGGARRLPPDARAASRPPGP